jgi:adenylate kinase
MNIVIFGPQGSGKGTQAKMLADRYGVPHISTGDIFREAAKKHDTLGLEVKRVMDAGALCSDALTNEVVKHRLEDVDCSEGFILDGYPRTLAQAEALDEFSHVDFVIVLEISDEEAVKRLSKRRQCQKCKKITGVSEGSACKSCGAKLVQRDDDTPALIQKRLDTYHELTQPLMEYYRPQEIIHIINGEQSPEKVFKDILGILGDE